MKIEQIVDTNKTMRAEELRLGNWIEIIDSKGVYTTVTKSTFDCDVDVFYKPIPITVDWLLKLGFEYHAFDKNYVITTKDDWHNSIKEIEGDWCYNNDFSDAGCYFVRDIKYVHQLQNLYYAINEEELICK
jgi:hypothetical protein